MPDSRIKLDALQEQISERKQQLADAKAKKSALEDRVEELKEKLDQMGVADEADIEELKEKEQSAFEDAVEAIEQIDSKLAAIDSDVENESVL